MALTMDSLGSTMLRLARWANGYRRKIRLLTFGGKKRWKKVASGFWMYLDPHDPTDQAILFGAYERGLIRCIHKLVRPGEICIDVGAEKGYIALQLARAVGRSGRVLAFEPDPRAVKELSENCIRNRVNSFVTIFEYALADKEGICQFFLTSQLGNSSRFPNEFARQQVIGEIKVPTKTLDQIVEQCDFFGNVSFIKIDAEGSEPLILKGMSRTLERFRPAIWLEINRRSLEVANFPLEMIQDPLRGMGYELFRLIEFRNYFLRLKFSLKPVLNLAEVGEELFDILAIPKEPKWQARLHALRL